MKKYILLIFLSMWMIVPAQQISRVADSPYPAAAQQPDRLYLTSESFGYSQKIVLQSLQGMLARTKPEILRDAHGHAATLEDYVTIDRTYYNNFSGLLARYADRFSGYILCEARTASVNVALSLCAVLNAIAVPADVEQTAINAGYTRVLDVRGKDEAWALTNYGAHFSKKIASYQAVNDDRALFVGDYSVFAGALQFWDASATGSLANAVYDRMNPLAVYFGWGAGEYNTVEQLSMHSAMIHPSDWSPNLSALSNIPVKLPRQKVEPEEFEVVPNVHTVCFVISDGDNIQWLSGSLNNTNNWSNPDKARLKLGWTVSPAFAELAPALYKKYIENALTTENARNYLVAGPSGAGYYFPGIYPQLADQNRFMNQMMKKADLNIVNIIDKDGIHNPDEYLKQSNVDALFYYSYGGQYTKIAGEIKWYKDKPSIGGRFTLWGNSSDGSAATRDRVCQSLANTLNSQSTNIHSASGYSLIPVHIWTMNPSDVLNCISKLNPNIRVVSPEEFVWLIRKNVRQLNIGNGNGLRAEYRLAANPEMPVLTTNEPTIDFDDEFLTEGTEAVGEQTFSTVWIGKVQAIYSQVYTFHSTAKGGVQLKINGRTLCDSLTNATVTSSDTITLEAGKQYDIEFRYQKSGAKGLALLEWESSSQVRQRIPRYQLFSRPMPNAGPVTAYDAIDYGGYSGGLKLGSYDAAALDRAGFTPASIKALRVLEGYKVVLFSGDSFTGDSLVATTDQTDLGAWADRAVSLKVLSNGADIAEGSFFIKPAGGTSVMGIDGGIKSTEDGKKVKLFRNTGAINQQFRFVAVKDRIYRIESVSSRKSLEIDNFSKAAGADVQQWKTSADAANQQFILVPTGEEGIYKILSCHSGKILEATSLSSLAQIIQSDDVNQLNARWQLELVPPLADGKGNGLTAEYYNGTAFNTLQATQTDTTINFSWGTAKPHRSVNADNFSIRWQGKIESRATGEYTFYVNSDNGRRLWVNNQLVIDKWLDDYDIEYEGNITLQANELYDIKLEYFESNGGAYCRLEWLNQKQPREIVPRSQLYSLDYSGTDKLNADDFFLLYPNPASGQLRVSVNEVYDGGMLKISDLSGRAILTQQLGMSDNKVDITQVPPGVYFVSFTGGNKSGVRKLIVK
ncbi:MAG: PA14 domain-containing protein [Paludibacter sp.]|nr:PA14 domain-containing protein [Paludibacter sp.]